jgi:hypothetical protein
LERATSSLVTSVKQATPREKAAVRSARLAEAHLAGNDLDGALDAANYGAELLEDKVSSVRDLDRLKEFSEQLRTHKAQPFASSANAFKHYPMQPDQYRVAGCEMALWEPVA